jgi:hypothetical protein
MSGPQRTTSAIVWTSGLLLDAVVGYRGGFKCELRLAMKLERMTESIPGQVVILLTGQAAVSVPKSFFANQRKYYY